MPSRRPRACDPSGPEPRVYAGLSARERDAERRQRLLDAALRLFGTAGYAATSADRVCTAAKVSTRHYYQLYANKEDLLLDLYASITQASMELVAASLEATLDEHFSVRLTAAIRAYLGPILEDPRVARIAFVEVVGVSPRVEARRLEFRNAIVALVEAEGARAVERGELGPRDFRFLALCFNGATNVVVQDWGIDGGGGAAETLQDDLCRVALRLFGADA
ncbi:MAG TPA: TetR/AcrR family transcriptional regulator [Acidimicrobiales bacterium]|nr:TetR/AcrR family transcriptional regulator [Acidimicrobiales bacterium]